MASMTERIQALLTMSNEATGIEDTTLTSAVKTLIEGYGKGGEEMPFSFSPTDSTVDSPYSFSHDGTHWEARFFADGSLTFREPTTVDMFIVGGGGGGGRYGGGGGGYSSTHYSVSFTSDEILLTIGAGGAGSAEDNVAGFDGGKTELNGRITDGYYLVYFASGGKGGMSGTGTSASARAGGNGGCGGGGGSRGTGNYAGGAGGTLGGNGTAGKAGSGNAGSGGKGQATTAGPSGESGETRAFGNGNEAFCGGGGGCNANASTNPNKDSFGGGGAGGTGVVPGNDGMNGYGGGGGASAIPGKGGSGVIIIRDARSMPVTYEGGESDGAN